MEVAPVEEHKDEGMWYTFNTQSIVNTYMHTCVYTYHGVLSTSSYLCDVRVQLLQCSNVCLW